MLYLGPQAHTIVMEESEWSGYSTMCNLEKADTTATLHVSNSVVSNGIALLEMEQSDISAWD